MLQSSLPPVLLTAVLLTRISVLYGCSGSFMGFIHSDTLFKIIFMISSFNDIVIRNL